MTHSLKSFGVIPIHKKLGKLFVLLVKHVNGHYWGFPKGKTNPGELPHLTAQRELKEETGLEIKELLSGRLFHETYSFEKEGVQVFKEVVYFPAFVTGEAMVAHPEEIEAMAWHELDELEAHLTYGPSKLIAKEFNQWIKEIIV